VRRPNPGEMFRKKELPFDDLDFRTKYGNIHSYLTETAYDGGQTRVTSTLLIFVEEGCLKLCINDRDNNRSCFVSAPTLSALLAALEDGLAQETLEWRTRRTHPGQPGYTPF